MIKIKYQAVKLQATESNSKQPVKPTKTNITSFVKLVPVDGDSPKMGKFRLKDYSSLSTFRW